MLPVLWRPCECTCVELIATLVSDAVLSINALQMQMQTGRDREMGEWNGVRIALLSSSLGGTAAAITRYLVTGADPVALAILRWGIGFLCLGPAALLMRVRWPARSDWLPVAVLGICFFGLFFILYNIAIGYTTAARASLALAILPLHTMLVAALLRVEPLTVRKTVGVCIAVFGAGAALAAGLSSAPTGAWRGELIMTAAVFCMAFYNVLSRPFMRRSSALGFLTVGMGAGAIVLVVVGLLTRSFATLGSFGTSQWLAGIYLGIGGGAAAFILWVMALERATPTRVANTMTINPIAAALLAALLIGEPVTLDLALGLVAVFGGIWLATSSAAPNPVVAPGAQRAPKG
jgi:drug/metabolite transporter (DMT)-like permease